MESKRIKPINKQATIYSGQSVNGFMVHVVQNTLPNYERSKYFVKSVTTDRRGMTKEKIVAKSNDIRKVSELVSSLLGRKVSLL